MKIRLVNLLLDPTATEGGGSATADVPIVPPAPPAAPPPARGDEGSGEPKAGGDEPPPAKEPETPPPALTLEEYKELLELRSKKEAFDEKLKNALSAKDREKLRLDAERQAAERRAKDIQQRKDDEAAELRTKLTSLEQRLEREETLALARERESKVARLTQGLIFVGKDDATRAKAAATFARMAEDALEAKRGEDGRVAVVGVKDGKPAEEILNALATEHDYLIARKVAPGFRPVGGEVPGDVQADVLEAHFADWRAKNTNGGRGLRPVNRN